MTPRGQFSILNVDTGGPSTGTIFEVDGKTTFHTDPDAPFVGFRFATTGVHTVTATLVGIGGNTVTSTTPLLVKAGPTSAARPSFFPDVAVAATTPSLLAAGGTGACIANSTVFFGAVEAQGCFKRVGAGSEIPAAERGAASEFISTNVLIENAQFANRCVFGSITCHIDPNELRIKDPQPCSRSSRPGPFTSTG